MISVWVGARGNPEHGSRATPLRSHGRQSIEIQVHEYILNLMRVIEYGTILRERPILRPQKEGNNKGRSLQRLERRLIIANDNVQSCGYFIRPGDVETGYLGLMSLLNQSVVCPVAGDTASCNTILGSEYAMLWDTIPLSVLGSITYGAVAVSAWWGLTSENATGVLQKKLVMAGSALLKLVANTKQQELEDQAMPGASLMAATILFLSLSLGNPDASEAGSRITRLDYKEPVITNQSSDRALALVARLRADDPEDAAESRESCYGTGNGSGMCVNPEYSSDVEEGVQDTIEKSEDASTILGSLGTVLLLISPFFFWGTSMVAMKELAPHTTPMLVAAWRLLPAGVVLLIWAYAAGNKGPSGAMGWLAVGLFGLIDGACFQGFLAEGLQRTPAGLGSVIIDSQPLSVAVIASVLFGESLGPVAVVGLFLGVAGLLLLEVPPNALSDLAHLQINTSALQTNSIWDSGEWWMLLAAQSMAVGTVMVRWVSKYCDPIAATGWHMILGGIPLLVLAQQENPGSSLNDILQFLTLKIIFFYCTYPYWVLQPVMAYFSTSYSSWESNTAQ
eukprot:jgi/Picre1/28771/NNA_004170.t1